MAKEESGQRANIGSASLILIFIVMCLVTFGMLSLSAAQNEWNLAERNAAAAAEYYRADTEGEAFYQMVSEKMEEACKEPGENERQRFLSQELGEFYREDENRTVTEIPMERAQALRVELCLSLENQGSIAVARWSVIQTEDLEIDNSMPVWTGAEDEETKE